MEGELNVAVDHTDLTPLDTPQLDAYTWHHLCLFLTTNTAYLYFNNTVYEMNLTDALPYDKEDREPEDVMVQLGDDINEFSGQLADVRFFRRNLSPDEVSRLYGCESGPMDYLSVREVSLTGEVRNASHPLGYMCLPLPNEFLALFSVNVDQESSKKFCQSLSGRLINRKDDMSAVSQEIYKSRDVNDDARMVWTEDMTDNEHGEAVYLIKRAFGEYHRKVIRNSSTVFSITACILPVRKKIFWIENTIKIFYFFPHRSQLILQSDDGEVILKSKCPLSDDHCLVLSHKGVLSAYTVLTQGHTILGRKRWVKYKTKTRYLATLSSCGTNSFTCDDGKCIDLFKRCDGRPHCLDQSDEGNICSPIQRRPSSYWHRACPVFRPEIDLYVKLDGVNQISLEKNEFTATLSVTISWRDHRLTFADLNNHIRSIETDTMRTIWVPGLDFSNARYEDNLHVRTKTEMLESFSAFATGKGRSQVINSYEVRLYDGTEVSISQKIQYLFTFSCDYDLFIFPFDTQECNMEIKLVGSQGCEPHWNVVNKKIYAKGDDSTISMYGISHIRFFYNMSTTYQDVMNLRLLFFRRFQAYLLTTFVPCIILYLLSELTLTHFRLDAFTDRITVTLSLLIVIASLFSQVTATLPSSPTPKFVDWFFFYCILRVSFIFFLHSTIGKRMRARHEVESRKNAAWVQMDKKDPKRRFKMPEIINNAGITIITLTDVVAFCLFVAWVVHDKNDKTRRFHALNVTGRFHSD
ncbi:uncharacterized protein [Procambarus clarkii]|uniref:uncharacterized protein n=1 Tax=Procambarus clarkii TaxID=6728 RepID=UPI0037433A96